MKMHLVYLAVSAFLLGVSPAQANNSTFSGDQHVCMTEIAGEEFTAFASTLHQARQKVLHACMQGGGSQKECNSNIECHVVGGTEQDDGNGQDDGNNQDDQNDQDDPNQGGQDDPDQDHPKKPHGKIYYDWGRGHNGFGYCYAFDKNGNVLYWGKPQPDVYCERVKSSHFAWARSWNGYIYCYQFTPYLAVMNNGYPVHPGYCRY